MLASFLDARIYSFLPFISWPTKKRGFFEVNKPSPQLQNLFLNSNEKTRMFFSGLLRKIKCSRLFESFLGVLGFFLVGVFVIGFLYYMDYGVSAAKYRGPVKPERFKGGSGCGSAKVEFLSDKGGECDVFDGDWVWDESYPLYRSKDCSFLDNGFRCSENGRPDLLYTKWRWQPKLCNLPRFNGKRMLENLRNKRLVFVGDSIGRNQWESLLCMLSSAVRDKSSIYEVNGSPITKHRGYLVFMFKDYNCTVEYYRSPFLVVQGRPPPGCPDKVKTTLKLDQMDWNSNKWKDADFLIFNTGHWWNHEKTVRGGCYFQVGEKLRLKMKVEQAYKRSIKTMMSWIHHEVNTNKTLVFFRTFAPVHFRGGDWRNGGSCHLETLPERGKPPEASETSDQFRRAIDVLSSFSNRHNATRLDILNITDMTARRKDGHSSRYYLGPDNLSPVHRQDCSHWCLPGVPDAWNELLYAFVLKHGLSQIVSSSVNAAVQNSST